jgi:TolB protein
MIDPPEDLVPESAVESGPEGDPDSDVAGEPDADRAMGSGRRRVRAAVALILVVAIVVFGGIGGARLARNPIVDPSAAVNAARLAAVDANGTLATMDGVGGSVVPYSVPGIAFEFPAWSPDGTHVAAIGHDGDSVGIYVLSAPAVGQPTAADVPRVVYSTPDRPPFYLYWTPDSKELSFLTTEPDGIALRIAPADASAGDAIIRHGAPLYWDWVDPGRLIAHIGGDAPDAFLGELGLNPASDGGATIEPGATLLPGEFRSPAVSRDGRFRAYIAAGGDAAQELVVEARDGSNTRRLAVAGATALAFDPAGMSLAFVAPEASTTEPSGLPIGPLRLIDPASGASRTLLGGRVVAFFWAPDGKTIAVLRVTGPGNDGVEAATTRVVSAVARLAISETSSPAAIEASAGFGLHLAFVDVATAAVRSERDVRVSDLFVNQILPFFDQYALSHRFWSADSASIALPLLSAGGAVQVVVLPADGSDPHAIADRVIGFWSP